MVEFQIGLYVFLVGEIPGVFLLCGDALLVLVETGEAVFHQLRHLPGFQRLPDEGMAAAYLGQACAVGDEHRFPELHGLDDGQPESLSLAGEEECLAIPVQPYLLLLADFSAEEGVAGGQGFDLLADVPGVAEVVVPADVEVVVGEEGHHVHQFLEILLLPYLSDGEKERPLPYECGSLPLAPLYVLHAVVDNSGLLLPTQAELLLNLFSHILGDGGDGICPVDGSLQLDVVFHPAEPPPFRQVVEVVYGQDVFSASPASPFQLLLVGGVPQVHGGQAFPEVFVELPPEVGGGYLRGEFPVAVGGQQIVEMQRAVVLLGKQSGVVVLQLSEAAAVIVDFGQIQKYCWFFHDVLWLKETGCHGFQPLPDPVGGDEAHSLLVAHSPAALFGQRDEVVGADAGEPLPLVGQPDVLGDVGRENGEGGHLQGLRHVPRAALVAEKELAVAEQGAQVGQRRCLDVGEDMRVVPQFPLVPQCGLPFLSREVEDDLSVKIPDNSLENVPHIFAGPHLVLQSGGGSGHDDGFGEVNASLLHQRAVFLLPLFWDIEPEIRAFLYGSYRREGVEEHVVLLQAASRTLLVVGNPVVQYPLPVFLPASYSERRGQGEEGEP